jgi:hypothetical protein
LVAFFTSDFFASGSGGSRRGQPDLGSINGQPIDQSDYLEAWKEVRIATYLHTGKWPGNDESSSHRMENETISRVFVLRKLKDMDIRASDKAAAFMVQQDLRDVPYATLEKDLLQPNNLTIADYERYVRHESSLRQLISAATVTARLVSPDEAEGLWRKENQEVVGQAACFWTTNYLSKVVLTNGAIETFYTNRMPVYRLPERLILSFVEFNASNYLTEADASLAKHTNLTEIITEVYQARVRTGTNAWTDDNGAPLSEAAAKDKIREEFRTSEALLAARRAATDFGNELIGRPDPNRATNLEYVASLKNLAVRFTNPFDNRTNGLDEIETNEVVTARSEDAPRQSVRDIVREKAFTLTDDRAVLFNPIPGKRAVYVIARKGKVPSEMQPLDRIREKVTSDYKNFMAFMQAREAGMAFQGAVTNGLAQKKSFEELAAASHALLVDVPPFSSTTRSLPNADPRFNLRQLQGMADDLEVGKTTPFTSVPPLEGGYVFYAKARPPMDATKLKAELPDFINQLRVYRQNEAFQQWFRKQAEQARLSGPKRETSINSQN